MKDYVICPYCEKKFKSLIPHLKKHNKNGNDLKNEFPDQPIISDQTKSKITKWQCENKKKTNEEIKKFLHSINYKWIGNEYINIYSKLKIQCNKGHISEIRYDQLQSGHKCHECHNEWKRKNFSGENNPNWKGGYQLKNLPRYNIYSKRISYAEECKRNELDINILDVKCAYCGKWFTPTISQINERIRSLEGRQFGEHRLYCSEQCKQECPIFHQISYSKNYKPATSREVQPELRQMRFEIDNYTCKECKKNQDELEIGLHCHHIEGIKWDPLESADVDKVITLCKNCHIKVHKKEGCGYNELKCENNI